VDDLEIKSLVTRLSRANRTGGVVIERAAILADGADFPAVMDWIVAHEGRPDAVVAAPPRRGLHGPRLSDSASAAAPLRFVLPLAALD
jgi:hypothetical protein